MSVKEADDTTFQQELQGSDKVIIKYFADWCGVCRLMAPKFRRLSDEEQFAGIKFLDINAEKNPQARKWAGVSNLPYFVAVKGGEVLEKGCFSKDEKMTELLNKLNA